MALNFQNLTDKTLGAMPDEADFLAVGVVREIAKNTRVYLNVDKVDDCFEVNVTVYSNGKPVVPMKDKYCFDLSEQADMLFCVRGLISNDVGYPDNFLIETYKPRKKPVLRIVN